MSKLSLMCYNQGELPPSYILGWSHSHLPGSKHGHSYLTYPWNQLKVIDMLNDCSRGYPQNCCYSKQLSMALLHASHPPAQSGGGEDILYIFFLIFPRYLDFWTPLQIPIWGTPLAARCYILSLSLPSSTMCLPLSVSTYIWPSLFMICSVSLWSSSSMKYW